MHQISDLYCVVEIFTYSTSMYVSLYVHPPLANNLVFPWHGVCASGQDLCLIHAHEHHESMLIQTHVHILT